MEYRKMVLMNLVENRLVDPGGKVRVGHPEKVALTYVYTIMWEIDSEREVAK